MGFIVEMWDVSCGGSVPGSLYSQTSLQHARHNVDVSQGTTQVAGELIVESLVATLGMAQANAAPLAPPTAAAAAAAKKVHVWGTPLCVGLCLVRLSSISPPTNRDSGTLPPLQAESLLDNIQIEWSPELASFVTSLVRYSIMLVTITHY